jgi:hypothetical protein
VFQRDGLVHFVARIDGMVKAWSYAPATDTWMVRKPWPLEAEGAWYGAQSGRRMFIHMGNDFVEFLPE